MSQIISNDENILDSRDVNARIDALKEAKQDIEEELETLECLAEEMSAYADWKHGATLIRDSYFKKYAQELAEDCGDIPKTYTWPISCIDWDRAARELQINDYTSVDFDGVTYWIRME